MTAARIALVAAIATVVIWTVKAIAIWQAGGLDKSDLEAPLFVLGLLTCLAAWGAIGAALTRGRALWVRAVAAVIGVAVGLLVVLALDSLSGAVLPESTGWVSDEAGLWAAAAVTLGAALAAPGGGTPRRTAEASQP